MASGSRFAEAAGDDRTPDQIVRRGPEYSVLVGPGLWLLVLSIFAASFEVFWRDDA